ncbi:MAG: pterin-binding protein [Chloroflexi bacterium RBG_16_51_9]|nr:MAG: pterin-binding protein [Chloroflexi bacterium RBG_16_51_9]
METKVSSAAKEVIISGNLPTRLIGERINPSGRKRLTQALQSGDLDMVRKEAIAQVKAGADIIDVNVGATGIDEAALLPKAVKIVMEAVDVPICIDAESPKALEAALKVYKGKPIVNSVKGEKKSLETVLPLIKEYGAAVIGLTIDDDGLPKTADKRVAIAARIIEWAEKLGIPRQDIIIDTLAMAIAADSKAAMLVLEAIRRINAEFGVNQTLGASNISFNLPDRELLNVAFLGAVITAGVTCPIVDAAKVRPAILSVDLVLGRDNYAQRYIRAFRQRQQA